MGVRGGYGGLEGVPKIPSEWVERVSVRVREG